MLIITGANGFVGQHLAPLALKYFKTKEILCLVRAKTAILEKTGLKRLKKAGLKFMAADLVYGEGLERLPKCPNIVIHLAANTNTSTSDHRVNDIGTKNLLKAIGPLGPNTHFIYTSTTIIMSGRRECSRSFSEYDTPWPTNEYGRSKLRAEEFLRGRAKKDKFPLTILRINTIYGGDPRENKLFKVLKKNIIRGSIMARLNWPGLTAIIHVDDVASAILMLAKKPPPKPGSPQTYLMYAENLSLSEISRLMHQKLGIEYRPIVLPKFFWKICSSIRNFIPIFEKITPIPIYNLIWRFGLIVDDVIWCESNKLFRALTKWKPRNFQDTWDDVTN